MLHCVSVFCVSEDCNAFQTSGNTNQQSSVTLFYSVVFVVLNKVLLVVHLLSYVWYLDSAVIINHFCFCAAILSFM
jgi:hypothetical protein